MALVRDPKTGKWIDDGTGFTNGIFGSNLGTVADAGLSIGGGGGISNAFLSPSLPGDYDKYGNQEPYEMADVNQQFTGVKSLFSLLASPEFNYFTSIADPTANTYDYSALIGGGFGANATGVGAAGGAGAAGPITVQTPTLTSALSSGDPLLADYAQRIAGGESPFTLQLELTAPNSGVPPEQLKTYENAISEMAKESIAAQQATTKPNAQQQWFAKTGMPDPTQTYDENNLPGDIVSPYLQQVGGRDEMLNVAYERAMKDYAQALGDNPYRLLNETPPPQKPEAKPGGPVIPEGVKDFSNDWFSAQLGPGAGEALGRLSGPGSNAAGAIPGAAGVGAAIQGGLPDQLGGVAGALAGPSRYADLGAAQRWWNRTLYGDEPMVGKLDLGGAPTAAAPEKVAGSAPPKGSSAEGNKGGLIAPPGPRLQQQEQQGPIPQKPPPRKPLYLGPLGDPNPNGGKPPPRKPLQFGPLPASVQAVLDGQDAGAAPRMPLDFFGATPGQAAPAQQQAMLRQSLAPPSWTSSDSPTVDGQLLTGRVLANRDSQEGQRARASSGKQQWKPGTAQYVATTQEGQLANQGYIAAQRVKQANARGDEIIRHLMAQQLQQQGRTPASDAQQAQLRMLRNMGIQI